MAPDDAEQNQQDSGWERCFRCGQMYPCESIRVLHGDCPEVFKDRSLCVACAEVVRGKRGVGWWFGTPSWASAAGPLERPWMGTYSWDLADFGPHL